MIPLIVQKLRLNLKTDPDLHSEPCKQVILRVGAETWTLRNLNSAVDHRHGLGERSSAKISKHPLERRVIVLCREAMQHR